MGVFVRTEEYIQAYDFAKLNHVHVKRTNINTNIWIWIWIWINRLFKNEICWQYITTDMNAV